MLLSLRSNPQTQRYIYKKVMVHVQAVAITSQQDFFDLLKIAITSISILTSPNISTLFQIRTNSLDFVTRAILFQESKINDK